MCNLSTKCFAKYFTSLFYHVSHIIVKYTQPKILRIAAKSPKTLNSQGFAAFGKIKICT